MKYLCIMFLCLMTVNAWAEKYELAICIQDEPDNPNPRKKEGDIIAVKPYPWNWGLKEIQHGFIIIVESNLKLGVMQLLSIPYYKDGKIPDIDSEPQIINKRRFSISFDKMKIELPEMERSKFEQKTYIYQPFKRADQLVQKFDGLKGSHYLTENDVDCGQFKYQEFNTEWKANVDFIYDKYLGRFINPNELEKILITNPIPSNN